MSKDSKEFFVKKNEWSVIKDELLACYLKPYFSKILTTRKPVNYVDCFAGKGKFDDGSKGSPLIALDIISNCLLASNIVSCPPVYSYFIERDNADDLKKNLRDYDDTKVIEGTYQDNIRTILSNKQNENVFLYIDPFGIKCLDFDLYDFYKNSNFSSIELFINFNSFGFIREACRVKKLENVYISEIDAIIQIFGGFDDKTIKSEQELTAIAGGDYWENIIRDYKYKKIDCYEAEKQLSEQYCNKLKERFRYVVNMPIRLKAGQKPKYRMIHATNHEEGCLLMVHDICKRWENLYSIQVKKTAPSLFEENVENEIIDESSTKKIILDYLKRYSAPVHMNVFLSELFTNEGVFTTWEILQTTLRELETNKEIELKRNPAITKTGKPTSFINESRKENHFIEIWIKK